MNENIKREVVGEYSFTLPLPSENEVRKLLEKEFGESRTFTDEEVHEITNGLNHKILAIMMGPVQPQKEENQDGQ